MKLATSYFPAQTEYEILDITIGELLRAIAAANSDSIAMVDILNTDECGQSWTYKELLAESERLAFALNTRFKMGERIVVWAPNIPEWIFMEYACALSGLTLVTANPSFQANELRYVLEQSGAVGLFIVNEFRGNPMEEIALEAAKGNAQLREITNLIDVQALYATRHLPTQLPRVHPGDAAQIQYTSGTTGFPKGAVLSHKNLLNNARLFCDRKGVGSHSVWANFMPLFHTAGCATGALGCLQAGAKMLLIKQFNADNIAQIIEAQKVTTCFTVPTMLFNLLESLEKIRRFP